MKNTLSVKANGQIRVNGADSGWWIHKSQFGWTTVNPDGYESNPVKTRKIALENTCLATDKKVVKIKARFQILKRYNRERLLAAWARNFEAKKLPDEKPFGTLDNNDLASEILYAEFNSEDILKAFTR